MDIVFEISYFLYLELRQQFFSHCGGSRVILSGLSSFEDLINVHFLQSRKCYSNTFQNNSVIMFTIVYNYLLEAPAPHPLAL